MQVYSLNGPWRMHRVNDPVWHEALVPGSVYADLLRDGSMEDPFWRENEHAAFALMQDDWLYTRTFTLDADFLLHQRILLNCEGLDTLARIAVNGEDVLQADNMHVTWCVDVKPLLHAGENRIEVTFFSPLKYVAAAYEKSPGWESTDAVPGFSHLRKAHCMFGWDWGPRLPDGGIWRDISLLGVDAGRILTVQILQQHEDGHVTLQLEPELDGTGTWTAEAVSPDGRRYPADADGCIRIEDPQLWWPHGYGDQPLYQVTVTLKDGDAVQDTWTRRIGLRTLTVSQEKDEVGEEFCHLCNGVKIFAMGADYIPEDNIFARITPERTRRLLEDARLANMNAIRVWGGGYYPDDFFYDLCDELGLLVWQDLMYACAFYDLTPDFERSIRLETEQNIRRIRHHASLALLCGNNEMEDFMAGTNAALVNGTPDYGPKRRSHVADYIKMYEYILPEICKRVAPQTFWWPSSPSSGGCFEYPQDPTRGDVHYWQVWHGEKPFTDYRNYRFRYASEFGFQSFPCLKTVESFTLPEDRNIFSRVMERHQRNSSANGKILAYLSQTYRYPDSFDKLLYASQLLQAEAIRYGVEHWRRHRGVCMGAIIWQLNDCWPVASWSSIDYYGRWKALHYAAKRFFAPVLLSCEEHGELDQNPHINEFRTTPIERSIRLNVCNETRRPFSGIVRWSLRRPDASILLEGEETVTVPALSACWLEKHEFPEASLTGSYAAFSLAVDGQIVSEGTALFCAPKHFEFTDPQLTVDLEDDEVVVSAKAYAQHVWIESADPDLLLSDNGFDLNGDTKRVRVLRGDPTGLRVRSVWDLDKQASSNE